MNLKKIAAAFLTSTLLLSSIAMASTVNKDFDSGFQNGIKVTAKAGVFPEGAHLQVDFSDEEIPNRTFGIISGDIDDDNEQTGPTGTASKNLDQDIKDKSEYLKLRKIAMLDKNNNPIQPANGKTFELWTEVNEGYDIDDVKIVFVREGKDEILERIRIATSNNKIYIVSKGSYFGDYALSDEKTATDIPHRSQLFWGIGITAAIILITTMIIYLIRRKKRV